LEFSGTLAHSDAVILRAIADQFTRDISACIIGGVGDGFVGHFQTKGWRDSRLRIERNQLDRRQGERGDPESIYIQRERGLIEVKSLYKMDESEKEL
jgi:hypothetical protein